MKNWKLWFWVIIFGLPLYLMNRQSSDDIVPEQKKWYPVLGYDYDLQKWIPLRDSLYLERDPSWPYRYIPKQKPQQRKALRYIHDSLEDKVQEIVEDELQSPNK